MDAELRAAVLKVFTESELIAGSYLAVKDAAEVKAWSLQQKYEQELGHEVYTLVKKAIKEAQDAL